ncbi:helix-turn-helix domain-containing protein, partial [Nocardia abscessus]|uniref:helix-turn-helix domain-containing protein n=1 Tax=Nocardia abscessus TaxID=120957 RepID=UPI0024570EFD
MIAEPDDDGHVQSVVAERGPTVLRIALGGQLRKLREKRNITREAAGEGGHGEHPKNKQSKLRRYNSNTTRVAGCAAPRVPHAKISRLELGRTGFKERDIRDLLTLYGVHDPEERESFLELARQAN